MDNFHLIFLQKRSALHCIFRFREYSSYHATINHSISLPLNVTIIQIDICFNLYVSRLISYFLLWIYIYPDKIEIFENYVIVFINCKISKNENEFNTMYNIIIYVCHSEDTLPNRYILQEMGSNLACVLIHLFLKRKEADSIQELIMNDKERLTLSFYFEFRV